MANTIRIARSVSTNTPSSLLQGELANSELGSPNSINELFIGTAGPTVFKLVKNTGGLPAEPNDTAQDNQTLTTGVGIDGADSGDAGDFTISLALDELSVASMVGADWIAFDNAGVSNKALISAINLGLFNNDQGWTNNVGTVTGVTGGTGITASGGASPTVEIDYLGTDNIIDAAANLESTAIDASDTIMYHDASDNNVKKGLISDLPFGSGSGDISRVDITAGIGLTGDLNTVTGDHIQTIDLDFSTLTDMTGNISGATEFIVQNGSVESRKAASEIQLSFFNNNSGWTSNVGDITRVDITAGIGLTGDLNTTSGNHIQTINMDFSSLTDMTGNISGATEFILQNGSTESRKVASEIQLSFFNNDDGWEANDANEILSTDTSVAGWSFVLDEDAMGSNSATKLATQQSIKAYIDNAVVGGVTHKGGYDADSDFPSLDATATVDLTGSIDVTASTTVNGVGTLFNSEIAVGDTLNVGVESRIVDTITNDTLLTVTVAFTNLPNDADPTKDGVIISNILLGDMYRVTSADNFFGEAVEIGDVLIADQDSPTTLAHWTRVQDNLGAASETAAGYIELATQAEMDTATDDLRAVTALKFANSTIDGGTF